MSPGCHMAMIPSLRVWLNNRRVGLISDRNLYIAVNLDNLREDPYFRAVIAPICCGFLPAS